jgi:hypothetical protein
MKFYDFRGKVHEVEPCEEAVFKKTVDGEVLYHTPKVKKTVTLGRAIDHISQIVASKPPYFRSKDIPWLLAHIHELRKHLSRQHAETLSIHIRGQLLTIIPQPAQEVDLIFIARELFALDIIRAYLLFGLVRIGDRFGENEIRAQEVRIESILPDDYDKFRRWQFEEKLENDFVNSKNFKSDMSKRWFAGVGVIAVVPDGEYLMVQDRRFDSGAMLHCEVDRFHKTEIGHYDMVGKVGYPKNSGTVNEEFEAYPLLKCSLMASNSHSVYCSAFVPLHWITHTLIYIGNADPKAHRVACHDPEYVHSEALDSSAGALVDAIKEKPHVVSPDMASYLAKPLGSGGGGPADS